MATSPLGRFALRAEFICELAFQVMDGELEARLGYELAHLDLELDEEACSKLRDEKMASDGRRFGYDKSVCVLTDVAR